MMLTMMMMMRNRFWSRARLYRHWNGCFFFTNVKTWMWLTGKVGRGLEPVCDVHTTLAWGDNPGRCLIAASNATRRWGSVGVHHPTAKAAFSWSPNRPETRHLGLCGETPTVWQELKCVTLDISNWQQHTHTHTRTLSHVWTAGQGQGGPTTH